MAGWIIRLYNLGLYNLSVLRAHIIEVYLTRIHNIIQLMLVMDGDFNSTLGYQEKATETICSLNLMVESVAPCLHTDP